MKNPSILKRTQTSIVLFVACVLSAIFIILYLQSARSLEEYSDDSLKRLANILSHEIEVDPSGSIEHDWNTEMRSRRDFAQSWDEHGNTVLKSAALKHMDLPRFHGKAGKLEFRNVNLPKGHRGRAVGMLVSPSFTNLPPEIAAKLKGPHPTQVLVVAIDTETYQHRIDRLLWILIASQIGIILISIIVIRRIIRKGLQPLENLSRKISKKNIDELGTGFLIQPDFPMELTDIVNKYNELLARVDRVRVRERDFAAYAAHELRTPLAGLSSTLELAIHRPRSTADYQERIKDCLGITDSMQVLIERLMTLSRLQNNITRIEPEPVDLRETVQSLQTAMADQQAPDLTPLIQCQWNAPSHQLTTDRHLLQMLLSNLLGNALQYRTPGSPVQLITRRVDAGIEINIINQAEGLTAEEIAKFSEPFYRKDKARSRNDNHFGMGLSICREITRVLGAGMKIHLTDESNFCVRVRFKTEPKTSG